MPEIKVTVDVPEGEFCNTEFEKCKYLQDLGFCGLFKDFGSSFLSDRWARITIKHTNCLEACERAKAESVTDCNGLEEK